MLKTEGPFIVLCDANTILKRRKNKNKTQISVCSGITVMGYHSIGEVVFSQQSAKKKFSNINCNLLSYARNFSVLPSSPLGISIHLNDTESSYRECYERMNDVHELYKNLVVNMEATISTNQTYDSNYTNMNIKCYKNKEAKEKILNFLKSLYAIISNNTVDAIILDKVFSLKIRMLRKSMISGTNTYNRKEIAQAIYALYELNSNEKLKNLYIGFKKSAINFRNITRALYFADKRTNEKKLFLDEVIMLFEDAFEFETEIIEEFLH